MDHGKSQGLLRLNFRQVINVMVSSQSKNSTSLLYDISKQILQRSRKIKSLYIQIKCHMIYKKTVSVSNNVEISNGLLTDNTL